MNRSTFCNQTGRRFGEVDADKKGTASLKKVKRSNLQNSSDLIRLIRFDYMDNVRKRWWNYEHAQKIRERERERERE